MDKGILKCVNIIWEREYKYMCCFYNKVFLRIKRFGFELFYGKILVYSIFIVLN